MKEYYWSDAPFGKTTGVSILMQEASNPAFGDQPCGRVFKTTSRNAWIAEQYSRPVSGDSRQTDHDTEEEARAYLLAVTRMT